MRREQAEAVKLTLAYYQSRWAEDADAVPRFLWNAKMRFGKTFTTYQLAKKLGAKRVLVLTFKPAVEDAWQTDLESHADFNGWQYLSRSSGSDPTQIDRNKPVVYFGSFQDLLGRDAAGNIKPRNEWLHTVNWDLVVFDEYHFGAWRETAKELFEEVGQLDHFFVCLGGGHQASRVLVIRAGGGGERHGRWGVGLRMGAARGA